MYVAVKKKSTGQMIVLREFAYTQDARKFLDEVFEMFYLTKENWEGMILCNLEEADNGIRGDT